MKPVLPFEPWMESRYRAVCHEIHELHVAKRVIPPDLSSERNALYRAIQEHFRYRPKPQSEEEKFYQERYENVVAQMTEYLSKVPDARYDRLRHERVYLATVLERLRVGLPPMVPKAVKEENGWLIVDETHDLEKAAEAFKSEYQNLPPDADTKQWWVGGEGPFSAEELEAERRTKVSAAREAATCQAISEASGRGTKPIVVRDVAEAFYKAGILERPKRPKPPHGLLPRKLWIEERIEALEHTIKQYGLAGCEVNAAWYSELKELQNVLQAINLTGG